MRPYIDSTPLGRRVRLDIAGLTVVAARARQPGFRRLLVAGPAWIGVCRTRALRAAARPSIVEELRREVAELRRQNAVLTSRMETVVTLCSVTLTLARRAAPSLDISELPFQGTMRMLREPP